MTDATPLTAYNTKPNDAVIEELENALRKARCGELQDVAIVGKLRNGDRFAAFETRNLFDMIANLELMKHKLLTVAPIYREERTPNDS